LGNQMPTDNHYILPLADSSSIPAKEAGAKATRLAEMMSWGFNVPDGWIVTERAFKSFCEYNEIPYGEAELLPEKVFQAVFPPHIKREIIQAIAGWSGDKCFAVRSSSSAEDGVEFSMAGQFETVLNVAEENVFEAVKRCWASRFGHPVSAYLKKREAKQVPSMGVIIQEQIQPEYSGVVFTLNPVTKSTDYLVVEWVEGLGEKLVSGLVVPERIYLRRASEALHENIPQQLLPHLLKLRTFALDAEKMSGHPIDMEWCCNVHGLYILQSRPITGISHKETVAWTNTNMAENFPKPLAPLAWSMVDTFYTVYMRCALKLFGWKESELLKVNDVLTTLNGIHCGRIYYNLNSWYEVMHFFPIGNWLSRFLDTYIGQKTTISLETDNRLNNGQSSLVKGKNLLLFWPRLIRTLKGAGRLLDDFEPAFYKERTGWREKTGHKATAKICSDTLHDIIRFVDNRWQGPVCADIKVMVSTGLLEVLIGRWVSEDVDSVMSKVMQGIEVKSTEPSKLIWTMAQSVKTDSKLSGLLQAGDYQELEKFLSREQRALLDSFMDDFGGRCYHDCMLVYPTFEERHDLYWDLVRGYLSSNDNADRWDRDNSSGRKQYVKSQLQSMSWWKKFVFTKVLGSAREATKLREQGRLFQSLLFGELRRTSLILGGCLTAMDHIKDPEDIFYLQLTEIRDLVEGKFQFPETIPDLIRLRQKIFLQSEELSPPEFFLSEKGAYCNPGKSRDDRQDSYGLKGLGVSGGKCTGMVKVVLDPSAGHDLQQGDILVTRTTDPGWTPLFFIAGGLVLEKGGMLSHGAIVAREFGIPAIVDMEGATEILKDGQMIEIDGNTGTVEILSEESMEQISV